MSPKQIYYETTAKKIIENMQKRNFEGYYCHTAKEAVTLANSFVCPGHTVYFGGSMTLQETGMINFLKSRDDITVIDRADAKTPEEITKIYREAFSCNSYFMSTNAITLEGELINIDGTGNRVSALIYGPDQVIILAGMNKVTSGRKTGIDRVKNIASPPNAIRLERKTPCSMTGSCQDCFSPDCICCNTVITRRTSTPGRIKIILIGEEYGY
ncbi:lactate utilization protein [Eubacterium oxidoreducens]|uniref:Uncharacterized ACR, YkgG family COG1556 n=1 Tax=Eubacterium oxidoreducens TaxID=1732 RepID=A0A1G6BG06_EUBOX|nr:lactate utilization protein [Eubacterium oxidoreducens]SDB19514.1 Uncharacterised ACR, YkgG family COG1556 [Eubacterium oxidoreducens]